MPGPAPKTPTPKLLAQVCERVRLGATALTAAASLGVSRATWNRWIEAGRKGNARYKAVAEAVDKAKAEFVIDALQQLRSCGPKEEKRWMWLLERRAPFEFGDERLVPDEAPPGEIAGRRLVIVMEPPEAGEGE